MVRRTNAVVYSSTNHGRQQKCISDHFLFYKENEAGTCDKASDNEPPCRNVLAGMAVVMMMKASVETMAESMTSQ